MSSTKIQASRLAYVSRESYSGWSSAGAIQGSTTGSKHPRVGAMQFSGLRDIDWAGQEIAEIRLNCTFAQAGLNRSKTLFFYRGAKSEISGTGAGMRGAYIGSAGTNGTAYNSARTITFSAAQNAAAFNGLIEWLQQDTAETLVIFADETPSGYDWSGNYLQIKAAELEIDHQPKGSKGTLDKTDVNAGETIALTVEPMEADGTVTHLVGWQMNGEILELKELKSGVTAASFTVPMRWLSNMPDSIRGEAQCLLYTMVNGSITGEREIPFGVVCPPDVIPSFTASVEPSGTDSGFYQRIGGAKISFKNVSAPYGATAAGYIIEGSEGFSSDQKSAVTPAFALSGGHMYTLTLIDSRGRRAVQTVQIDVQPVEEPQIETFTVQRYAAVIGDDGKTEYVPSMDGDHVRVSVAASVDPADGSNLSAAFIEYGPEGGATSVAGLDWTEGAEYKVQNSRAVITAQIPPDAAWNFTLTVADRASSVTAFARVEKSWAILHFAGNGCGVGVGMYSRATADAPKFESAWPAAFYGGVEGVTNYAEAETPTGGTWIDGRSIFRKIVLFGAITANTALETPIGVTAAALGDVISLRGMALGTYEGYAMPLPNPSSDHNFMIQLEVCSTNTAPAVRVITGKSREITGGFAIVEYTKKE